MTNAELRTGAALVRCLVYVGAWSRCPPGISRLTDFDYLHPRDFSAVTLDADGWTNNPLIVDLYPAERVLVCSRTGVRPLSDHPDWPRWKAEMSSGEFWSLVGEEWATVAAPQSVP